MAFNKKCLGFAAKEAMDPKIDDLADARLRAMFNQDVPGCIGDQEALPAGISPVLALVKQSVTKANADRERKKIRGKAIYQTFAKQFKDKVEATSLTATKDANGGGAQAPKSKRIDGKVGDFVAWAQEAKAKRVPKAAWKQQVLPLCAHVEHCVEDDAAARAIKKFETLSTKLSDMPSVAYRLVWHLVGARARGAKTLETFFVATDELETFKSVTGPIDFLKQCRSDFRGNDIKALHGHLHTFSHFAEQAREKYHDEEKEIRLRVKDVSELSQLLDSLPLDSKGFLSDQMFDKLELVIGAVEVAGAVKVVLVRSHLLVDDSLHGYRMATPQEALAAWKSSPRSKPSHVPGEVLHAASAGGGRFDTEAIVDLSAFGTGAKKKILFDGMHKAQPDDTDSSDSDADDDSDAGGPNKIDASAASGDSSDSDSSDSAYSRSHAATRAAAASEKIPDPLGSGSSSEDSSAEESGDSSSDSSNDDSSADESSDSGGDRRGGLRSGATLGVPADSNDKNSDSASAAVSTPPAPTKLPGGILKQLAKAERSTSDSPVKVEDEDEDEVFSDMDGLEKAARTLATNAKFPPTFHEAMTAFNAPPRGPTSKPKRELGKFDDVSPTQGLVTPQGSDGHGSITFNLQAWKEKNVPDSAGRRRLEQLEADNLSAQLQKAKNGIESETPSGSPVKSLSEKTSEDERMHDIAAIEKDLEMRKQALQEKVQEKFRLPDGSLPGKSFIEAGNAALRRTKSTTAGGSKSTSSPNAANAPASPSAKVDQEHADKLAPAMDTHKSKKAKKQKKHEGEDGDAKSTKKSKTVSTRAQPVQEVSETAMVVAEKDSGAVVELEADPDLVNFANVHDAYVELEQRSSSALMKIMNGQPSRKIMELIRKELGLPTWELFYKPAAFWYPDFLPSGLAAKEQFILLKKELTNAYTTQMLPVYFLSVSPTEATTWQSLVGDSITHQGLEQFGAFTTDFAVGKEKRWYAADGEQDLRAGYCERLSVQFTLI
eukprot:g18886.t1